MLIDQAKVREWLNTARIHVKGVLHIGAHDCEELPFYLSLGIQPTDVIWIDALYHKVAECQRKGIPNVYQGLLTDVDNELKTFYVANNMQSSSIFPFGTHAQHHDWVHYTDSIVLKTSRLDTFMKEKSLDASHYNFWNLDIQGAELLALRGASESLQWPEAIYIEVNTEEVYKGCGLRNEIDDLLARKGFIRVETNMTNAGWGDALYLRKLPVQE